MNTTVSGPEARFLLERVAIPQLTMEHRITCAVLEAIPEEMAELRPVEGGRSLGDLARHLVSAELRYLEGAARGVFSESAAIPGPRSLAESLLDFKSRFARALESLADLPGETLLRTLNYRGVIQMPALGFVGLAVSHTIHHRGQISVYLKLLAVPVPRIYG